jgi:hypothetical protein
MGFMVDEVALDMFLFPVYSRFLVLKLGAPILAKNVIGSCTPPKHTQTGMLILSHGTVFFNLGYTYPRRYMNTSYGVCEIERRRIISLFNTLFWGHAIA